MVRQSNTQSGNKIHRLTGVLCFTILISIFTNILFARQLPDNPPIEAPGRLIDVGGWHLHLQCNGQGDPGVPTVIIEAGAGAFSVDWSLVMAMSDSSFRLCAYDRAGTGWSSFGPSPCTFRQIVWELHTLLNRADIPPPYILAGHSFGGTLSRLFTLTYPDDIAGLILLNSIHELEFKTMVNGEIVTSASTATGRPIPDIQSADPFDLSSLPEQHQNQLKQIAEHMAVQQIQFPYNQLPDEVLEVRKWSFGQMSHWAAGFNSYQNEELKDLINRLWESEYPFGDLPILILSQDPETSATEVDAEYERFQSEFLRLSHNSSQVRIENVGHELHLYAPEQVYDAIRNFVSMFQDY